jgi:hypothetical protein
VVIDEADNCTAAPVVAFVSDVSDGNTCPEIITRTYSVTDDCGNSINVTQTITIDDTTNPTASNPSPITVQCFADVPASNIAVVTDEADNCTAAPVVAFVSDVSNGLTCPEVITRTYRVTDDCGNFTDVTQIITVDDTTPPVFAAPADVTYECIGDVPAPGMLAWTDNCDGSGEVLGVDGSDGLSCPETITRTWSYTDACGNPASVSQTITVHDQIAPQISGAITPIELTGCDVSVVPEPVSTVAALEGLGLTISDNCTDDTNLTVTSVDVSSGPCPIKVTRTYTLTDHCGNASSADAVFWINAQAVDLTVPSNYTGTTCMTQDAVNTAYTAFVNGASFTGGCGGVLTNDAPAAAPSFCGGSVTVTWTISSDCEADIVKSATFSIHPAPEILLTPNPDQTVIVEDGCYPQEQINLAFNEWINKKVEVGGGCNPYVIAPTGLAPGNCGSVTLIWTASDGCSVVTANSTFTVDNSAPTPLNVDFPQDLTIEFQSQEDVDAAFSLWIDEFDYNFGGCGEILIETLPAILEPPTLLTCSGGSTTVIWTVTSECEVVSHTATFTVNNWPVIEEYQSNPPLSGLYDGRNTAYVTNGVSGSENNLVEWLSASWTRCLQSGVDIDIPPDPTSNSKSDLYIQISAGDYITVERISYKNNFTLVVCGYLEIGDFNIVEDDEDEGAFLNNVNIFICPGGVLKAKLLDLKNTILIVNHGIMQVDSINAQTSASSQCIMGTGEFLDTDGNTIIYHDPVTDTWIADVNYISFIPPLPEDTTQLPSPIGWTFGDGCDDYAIGILPIELLSFNSEIKPDRINLLWTTGTEINNDYFTIERSREMTAWEVLGFVDGAGDSSVPIDYSYSDLNPLDGLAYYRLKQTDFDGKFKYYGPVAAHYDLGMDGLDFKVMKQYHEWIIAVPSDGVYQVEVYTLTGRRLISEKVENTLTIPAPEGGVVIRVTDGFARSASRVVM